MIFVIIVRLYSMGAIIIQLCPGSVMMGGGMEEAAVQALRESMNRASQDGAHIGVGNLHRRIRLRYGQEYGVEISSAKNVRTLVMLWLPG